MGDIAEPWISEKLKAGCKIFDGTLTERRSVC